MNRSWKSLAVAAALALQSSAYAQDPAADKLLQDALEKAAVDGPRPLAPGAQAIANELSMGKTMPLGALTQNRGARLLVHSITKRQGYANLVAEPGSAFLIIDTEWENLIPLTLVYERQTPTTYQIPNLRDHLYVVVDGKQLARIEPKENDVPGHVPVTDFKLERIGSRIRGNIVFVIPDGTIDAAELRFYDFAHGHMTLPLLDKTPETPPAEEKPVTPLVKNEVLQAGVYAVERAPKLGSVDAPAGMNFVTVDFRATSQFTYEVDASAFQPKAQKGAKMKVGTVADWTDSRKYMQLVVDGAYGYVPLEQTKLVPQPRFLPDVMTGGRVTFLAPAESKSLELRCDFPNAKTPSGQVIRPRGITFTLEGQRPLFPNNKPLAKIDDKPFEVLAVDQATPDLVNGKKAAAGKRWVTVDYTVRNRGTDGEMFQTKEQVSLVAANGAKIDVDPASFELIHRPTELVWIPPGEHRSFQAAYQLPEGDNVVRLNYAGVTKAEVVELARLAPMAALGAATEKPAGNQKPAVNEKPPEVAVAAPGANDPKPEVVKPPANVPAKPNDKPLEVNGKRFPSRVPIKPNIAAKGIAGVGLKQEQINEAIDEGAAAIWKQIKTKDMGEQKRPFGSVREHFIAALALVHSDAHKKFPDFDAELRKFLAGFKANENGDTYQIGIYCMLVEAYGDPTYYPQMRAAARWLVEAQGPEGSWGYGKRFNDPKLFGEQKERRVLVVAGGIPLDESAVSAPMERVTDRKFGADGDNSATQYALLGLHSASRSRVKATADLWKLALKVHMHRQDKETGGFPYETGSSVYGAMTCAGICALALTQYEAGLTDPTITERIERGLAWMSANFSVKEHPKGSESWLHYYLYSIERVGRILDTEFIGEHEWYPLGAKFLVDQQKSDGTWMGEGEEKDPRIAGSFALLFLTRATPSLGDIHRSGPGTVKTAVSLPEGRKVYIILDASGSMLEEMDGKPKFEIARGAVAALIKELPDNAQVALRVYGHRKRAIDENASQDSEQVIPMGPLNRKTFLTTLENLSARGKTPMALSLEESVGEVPEGTEESPTTVLLLTDGGEDSQPRKDPVAAAAAFGKREHTRVRIVGFDINREDWTEQLQSMAKASGGQFLPATKGESLLQGLRTAVFETPDEFAIFDQNKKQVGGGKFGESLTLPAGKYTIRATYASRAFEETLWVNAGTTTAVTFAAANVTPDAGTPIEKTDAPAGQAPTTPPANAGTTPAAPATPASPAAKFCTNCGQGLKADAKFCTNCGTPAK